MSRFESDPAVQALRAYYAAVAEAVNAKNPRLPALDALSSARQRTLNSQTLKGEIGSFVPGPVPFMPLGVRVVSAEERRVTYCAMSDGWSEDPKTKKPLKPVDVVGLESTMSSRSGRWVVALSEFKPKISCDKVKLP